MQCLQITLRGNVRYIIKDLVSLRFGSIDTLALDFYARYSLLLSSVLFKYDFFDFRYHKQNNR